LPSLILWLLIKMIGLDICSSFPDFWHNVNYLTVMLQKRANK